MRPGRHNGHAAPRPVALGQQVKVRVVSLFLEGADPEVIGRALLTSTENVLNVIREAFRGMSALISDQQAQIEQQQAAVSPTAQGDGDHG